MLHDQLATVLEAMVVPLLLINSVAILRAAYAGVQAIASGAARTGCKTCERIAAKIAAMLSAAIPQH